jgi:Domain of unknown function (DUF4386)
LLQQLRDLGLPVISVSPVDPGHVAASDSGKRLSQVAETPQRFRPREENSMHPDTKTARMAGLLYLIGGVTGAFGIAYAPSILVVPADASATARNILASELLFRLSVVSALVTQVVFIFVALALYQLLKSVNKNMAALMVILLLLGVPIAMLNELNNFAVLVLLHGAQDSTVLTADQAHAVAALFLDLHALGLSIADLFFGLWLFPLGYLVFTSGFLPRLLGVLLLIGCFGYLIQSGAALLFPDLKVNVVLFTGWVEVVFALWLLLRGVNVERWDTRARASA